MRTLQKAGYVAVSKSYKEKRPLTTCCLTAEGSDVFRGYVDLLEAIVQLARKTN
ncbi:MAG: transcriptional regulator [Limisphaerales bacterium]